MKHQIVFMKECLSPNKEGPTLNFSRSKFGKVYVQVYDRERRGCKYLPRSETRHLDPLTDEQIWDWIRERLAAEMGPISNLSCPTPLNRGPSVLPLSVILNFERWLNFLAEQKLERSTIKQHRSYGTRFVLEFFGRVAKEPDPSSWPKYCAKFYTWLITEADKKLVCNKDGSLKFNDKDEPVFISVPCTPHQIRAANSALRKFYNWLAEEGFVPSVELRLRKPQGIKAGVQLPRPVRPEEVLKWSRSCPDAIVKFLGLVGYFFSLRPQEAFALRPRDFRAGSQIEELECVKVMKDAQLYGRLGVYIGRQKQNSGMVKEGAKKGSNGWVACFNEEAAREIVKLLGEFNPAEEVAKWNNRKLYHEWRKAGIEDLAPKDLRRASLYWLGHYTKMKPLQLMKHARHRNVQTTMGYAQRPEELGPQELGNGCLDLDLDS